MSRGIIFDIKEMTVHDGPGVRVTVFFKGCPLKCLWCHNPEGLSSEPQPMKESGRGVKTSGQMMDATELAARVIKNAGMLQQLGGGVTISGGEPLMQPAFLLETLRELASMHRVLQTSGHGDTEVFSNAVDNCELVHFDLKQMSSELHQRYTGKDNTLIMQNLELLKASGKHFVVRMPMIPGVNICEQHFRAVTDCLIGVRDRVSIEILPYNVFAGAKYPLLGMEYYFKPKQDELEKPSYPAYIFEDANLKYRIL